MFKSWWKDTQEMKKFFFSLLFLLNPSLTNAEWSLVTSDSNNNSFYIDLTMVERKGNFIKVWEKVEYGLPQKVDETREFQSVRFYIEYDCQEKKLRTLNSQPFPEKNLQGKGITNAFTSSPREWISATLSTQGTRNLNTVCNIVEKQKDIKTLPIKDISKLDVISMPNGDTFYPSFSKRAGEQGDVILRLIINESGEVEEARILQTSTYRRLDRAAMDMAQNILFKPFIFNGSPTKTSTNMIIKFNLKK
jgi:TonB family protein